MDSTRNYQDATIVGERDAALYVFRRQKAFAEHCLQQVSDAQFFALPADDMNSLAVLVKHLAGNMRSRWSDFDAMLRHEVDGEKGDRDREREFEVGEPTSANRASLMQAWDEGWSCVFAAIESLDAARFEQTVRIRGVELSVHLAVLRQIDHYAYHVGQMAFIARMLAGSAGWQWFTMKKP
ncbi:MAG: DUF1572 family protein [Planctomycetota bacterium]